MELAGEVEAVGNEVTRLKPGDEVFGFAGFGFGAYAEYICLPEHGTMNKGLVELKPDNLAFEEAAVLPGGGMTALALIQKAKIDAGQKVLIYGASGSVGAYALQLAKHHAAEVTAVCSGSNLEMVKSLGADHVIDYTRQDFTRADEGYDVILDAVHKLNPWEAKRALKPGGTYLDVHKDSDSDRNAGPKAMEKLKVLAELEVLNPVIDRRYALEDIVSAHRYVESGHKKGNVVVEINVEPSKSD
jgi:NADPH:quinone reductase-like Zn-dependent oxidoreductase